MKRILAYTLFCLLPLVFTGCYKDKGNYSYADLPAFSVDTAGFQMNYLKLQLDELTIDPPLAYSGEPGDLLYSWKIYTNGDAPGTSRDRPVEEISTAKVLTYIINQKPGIYTLEFVATNRITQEKAMERFKLTVTNALSEGWMILHEKEGVSDIDFLMTPELLPALAGDELVRNIYSELNNGQKIIGNPLQVVNCKMKRTATRTDNLVYVVTDNSLMRLSGDDFTLLQENESLFFLPPAVFKPQRYTVPAGFYAFYEMLINDGGLHQILTGYGDNNGQFSSRVTGDYVASPYVPQNPPSLTAAIYDEKKGRFLSLGFVASEVTPYPPAAGGTLFDLNTINKTLLYLEGGFNNNDYCVFKDRNGEDRYLYIVRFSQANAGTPAIGLYNMSGAVNIANATAYAIGNRGNVFYYAADNVIYFYDYSGSNTSRIEHQFPVGEKITSMKLFKKTGHTLNGKLLFVATYNEGSGEGKVYQFSVNEVNGVIDGATPKAFTGFGKIADMNLKQ